MSENICNVCGANLIYKDGRWVCPACGAYKEEEISNEEVTLLYNASQKLRLASFDDAEELYEDIVKKYPKNSEAHWGLVLSRYGIKYEDDYDGRKLPTCYAVTMESFLDDKEYLAALSCAPDAKIKAYYEEQGKIIEKNRIEWCEKASKEPAYDVFLCFKDSDKENNIERTDDSIEVANLYTYLSGKGYRVFFSRETLRDKVAEKYEPYIYNALNTASVMIVYGSKPEYFESVWMKNEWTRFLKRMREGLKVDGSLIVAYDGMNPAELPKMFAGRQCLDARKKTFYGDLEMLIARVIAIAKRPKAAVERIEIKGVVGRKKTSVGKQIKTIQAGGAVGRKAPVTFNTGVATREIGQYEVPELTPDEETQTKNVFRFIQAGLFDNAQFLVNNILSKNRYNGKALLATLLVRYEATDILSLADKIDSADDFSLIYQVIEYNEKGYGEQVIEAICRYILHQNADGNYAKAISCLEKIDLYNSYTLKRLKDEIASSIPAMLKSNSEQAEVYFDHILKRCSDIKQYLAQSEEIVQKCVRCGCFSLAIKYNEQLKEKDCGNMIAVIADMLIAAKATNWRQFLLQADSFHDFSNLETAVTYFTKNDLIEFFGITATVFYATVRNQMTSEAICSWFEFNAKYEYPDRTEFLEEAKASIQLVNGIQKQADFLSCVLKYVDCNDVEQHIRLRLDFACRAQTSGALEMAEQYYREVLEIDEGNLVARWEIMMCHCGVKDDDFLFEKIQNFTYFDQLKQLLQYCPTADLQLFWLNLLIEAALKASSNCEDGYRMSDIAKVFDGIIRYYPQENNKQLNRYVMVFADNCKKFKIFDLAEKYYIMMLSIDANQHFAYWGILQAKCKCRNNYELVDQPEPITEFSEFNNAILATGDDEDSAKLYIRVALYQRAEQKRKEEAAIVAEQERLKRIEEERIKEQERQNKARVDKLIRKKVRKMKFGWRLLFVAKIFALFSVLALWNCYAYQNVWKNGIWNLFGTDNWFYLLMFILWLFVLLTIWLSLRKKYRLRTGFYLNVLEQIKQNNGVKKLPKSRIIQNAAAVILPICCSIAIAGFWSFLNYRETESALKYRLIKNENAYTVSAGRFYQATNPELQPSINDVPLKVISEGAFQNNRSIEKIVLRPGIVRIENNAFLNCTSLKTVFIPASVTYIGENAFSGCKSLESIVFETRDDGIRYFDAKWNNGIPETSTISLGFQLSLVYGRFAGDTGSEMKIVEFGKNYSLPVPTRYGYTFAGWYTAEQNGEQLTDENGHSLEPYGKRTGITCYAVWKPNENTITFDSNGGSGTMIVQTICTDESIPLNQNTFVRPGYSFAGWSLERNGQLFYLDGQKIKMGETSIILYAVWTPNENTIRFDANGGNGFLRIQTVATDQTERLLKNTYNRTGYIFAGWATEPDGVVVYADQASYTMGTEASYTLYAIWELVDYSISYKLDGGAVNGNPLTYNLLTDSFTLNSPTRPGYTFLGWSGSGIDGVSLSVTIKIGSIGNRVYTANWKANSNRIIFHANGGEGTMEDQWIDSNETALLNPNTFVREHYDFAGWSNDPIGALAYSDQSSYPMGTSSINHLYALWMPKKYSISYVLNDGLCDNPDYYTILSEDIYLKAPYKKVADFVGWIYEGEETPQKEVIIKKGSSGNKTYTAVWNEYLKYELNDSHTYTITGLSDRYYSLESLELPDKYNGILVTEIASFAFANNEYLKYISLSKSIVKIGDHAFYKTHLNTNCQVEFPEGLEFIGDYAFYHSFLTVSIYIPQSVSYIGNCAFVPDYQSDMDRGITIIKVIDYKIYIKDGTITGNWHKTWYSNPALGGVVYELKGKVEIFSY